MLGMGHHGPTPRSSAPSPEGRTRQVHGLRPDCQELRIHNSPDRPRPLGRRDTPTEAQSLFKGQTGQSWQQKWPEPPGPPTVLQGQRE